MKKSMIAVMLSIMMAVLSVGGGYAPALAAETTSEEAERIEQNEAADPEEADVNEDANTGESAEDGSAEEAILAVEGEPVQKGESAQEAEPAQETEPEQEIGEESDSESDEAVEENESEQDDASETANTSEIAADDEEEEIPDITDMPVETVESAETDIIEEEVIIEDENVAMAADVWLWPFPTSTTVNSGFRTSSRPDHDGVDIGANIGDPIYAVNDGTIYKKYEGCNRYGGYGTPCNSVGVCNPNHGYWSGYCNNGYGNGICLKTNDGYYVQFAHMQSVNSSLYEGQYVTKGTLLGYVGGSGAATGKHCHYAVSTGGEFSGFVNPMNMSYTYEDPASTADPIPTGAQIIPNGNYHIVSALDNSKGLDVYNNSSADGTNVDIFSNTEDSTQVFTVRYLGDGSYAIIHKSSGKYLDVSGAALYNGANVNIWTSNNSDAQKWVISAVGDGRYFNIISKCNGRYLDVANGTAADFTNVQVYGNNGTDAQKWRFIPAEEFVSPGTQCVPDGTYHIVSALDNSKGIDVYNNQSADGTNVDLYANTADDSQMFTVKYLGNGFYSLIHKSSGKCLDVYDASIQYGTNVTIWTSNNTKAQQWVIKSAGDGQYFYIISRCNGLYLDVARGFTENLTNIQVYGYNGTNAQKWKFVQEDSTICKTHQWNKEYTVDKEATTTEEGSKSIHCSVCDAVKPGSEVSIPKLTIPLGKTSRGDMFNLANNVKVTWKAVPGAKYYKVYREGITDPSESLDEPVIVTERLIGWDQQPGLTNGHAYRYTIVASMTGKGDPSGDSKLSYSKLMYRLKTVVIRSVKNTAPGKVTVKYDKTTSGDSYVLQYCEREDMVGAKTKVVLGANNTSYTIGGLKKGKTYYISIRVRKKVDGIDYYTTFGVAKKITITQ